MQPQLDAEIIVSTNRTSPGAINWFWASISRRSRAAAIARRLFVGLLLIASPSGCDTFQKKHDSPVMVQAPLRVGKVEADETSEDEQYAQNSSAASSNQQPARSAKPKEKEVAVKKEAGKLRQVASKDGDSISVRSNNMPDKEFDGSEIKQVSATPPKNPWENWKDDTAIFNAQVAATVNGAPILNGDVLDQYSPYLISVREELQKVAKNPPPGQPIPTPEDYEKFRYQLIQRNIAAFIQKKLLVERLKSGLKPEQVKLMEEHVDDMFAKEIERLKGELKVTNKTELEIALNKRGTTLANVRANFALDKLAMECVGLKSDKPLPVERPDLIAYYQSNPEKFTYPAKVKWQQIQVSITSDVSKRAARKKLEQAIAELEKGVPFEKVAKKYSDGPTAKQGGSWDWMEAGNLKDKAVEKKLFTMPLNTLSEICESEEAVCVVRVTDREEAGRKPFQDVQQEIRAVLEEEQHRKRPKRLMKDLFNNAVIETQYTLPNFVPEE